MGIFNNCQIVIEFGNSIRFKEKKELRTAVTDNGGVISYIITKKSKYVVAVGIANAEDTYKCRTAQKLGIPIVSADFIKDSIEAGKLLDHDGYLVAGKTRAEEFKTGKIPGKTSTKATQKKKMNVNISNIKVWNADENSAPDFNDERAQVAKFAIFLVPKKDQRSQIGFGRMPKEKVKPVKDDLDDCDVYSVELHSDPQAQDYQMKYRIFTSYGSFSQAEPKKQCHYTNSIDAALAVYASVYKEHPEKKRFKGRLPGQVGSSKLQQAYREKSVGGSQLDSSITQLVSYLWSEAMGELDDVVCRPLSHIGNEKVEKGESLLKELLTALDKEKPQDEIQRLSDEFYVEIPHHPKHYKLLNDKRLIAKKLDLCQLIRDMYAVAEATNWSSKCSPEAQYNALNCEMEELSEGEERQRIIDLLRDSVVEGEPVPEFKVYTVVRPMEEQNFTSNIDNKQLLLHASGVHNFVGILSRGLLLPKVMVEDYGVERTDIGMLGSGIYFSDSATTSVKYSKPSKMFHSRMMVVNEVALGAVHKVNAYNTELKAPPTDFNSVHGISKRKNAFSQFEDDEYVIYDTKQQRIKYLVEFWLPEDGYVPDFRLDNFIPEIESDVDADDDHVKSIDLKDVQNVKDPLDKVALGLVSNSDAKVPLQEVHVRAQLVDLAAKVIVFQEYLNESDDPIEAKYVFPLDEMAAVCGFEAFINGKHVVGEVKEKETAHREYKQAIAEGHGAYLMDQDEETPEIFTVSVGNLPAYASVIIKITYVAELRVEDEKIQFAIPGSVAPWKKDKALGEVTQTTHDTVKIDDMIDKVSIEVSIEMPFPIRSIESPTHKIFIKKTETKAVVGMARQLLDSGFLLQIGLAEIHVPRMWVERHPEKTLEDKQYEASMLTFYPEFETEDNPSFEVVFLLDCSNSMNQAASVEAKKILLLALHHLGNQCSFNIVKFGSGFEELFPSSQMKTNQNVKLAENFLQNTANFGNTDVYKPLFSYFLLPPEDTVRNVFLISDGHVTNADMTLSALRDNFQHTRLFTFGVSSSANRHMLRSLAQAGAGFFEFFDNKMKSKWEGKVKAQLQKASQPVLTSVQIEWKQHDNHRRYCLQAPTKVTSLFNGSRLVVYGYVQDCTQAMLTAVIDGREVSTLVSTSELSISSGKILHQLTARAVIRDWETGLLDDDRTEHEVVKRNRKNYIIGLSKEYSIVTQFTSFVAIEKREKDEKFVNPEMDELLEEEDMDILAYMEYEGMEMSETESDESSSIASSDLERELEEICGDELETMNMDMYGYGEFSECISRPVGRGRRSRSRSSSASSSDMAHASQSRRYNLVASGSSSDSEDDFAGWGGGSSLPQNVVADATVEVEDEEEDDMGFCLFSKQMSRAIAKIKLQQEEDSAYRQMEEVRDEELVNPVVDEELRVVGKLTSREIEEQGEMLDALEKKSDRLQARVSGFSAKASPGIFAMQQAHAAPEPLPMLGSAALKAAPRMKKKRMMTSLTRDEDPEVMTFGAAPQSTFVQMAELDIEEDVPMYGLFGDGGGSPPPSPPSVLERMRARRECLASTEAPIPTTVPEALAMSQHDEPSAHSGGPYADTYSSMIGMMAAPPPPPPPAAALRYAKAFDHSEFKMMMASPPPAAALGMPAPPPPPPLTAALGLALSFVGGMPKMQARAAPAMMKMASHARPPPPAAPGMPAPTPPPPPGAAPDRASFRARPVQLPQMQAQQAAPAMMKMASHAPPPPPAAPDRASFCARPVQLPQMQAQSAPAPAMMKMASHAPPPPPAAPVMMKMASHAPPPPPAAPVMMKMASHAPPPPPAAPVMMKMASHAPPPPPAAPVARPSPPKAITQKSMSRPARKTHGGVETDALLPLSDEVESAEHDTTERFTTSSAPRLRARGAGMGLGMGLKMSEPESGRSGLLESIRVSGKQSLKMSAPESGRGGLLQSIRTSGSQRQLRGGDLPTNERGPKAELADSFDAVSEALSAEAPVMKGLAYAKSAGPGVDKLKRFSGRKGKPIIRTEGFSPGRMMKVAGAKDLDIEIFEGPIHRGMGLKKDLFDTNPYASQDSEGYFSDTTIPRVLLNKKMKNLDLLEIKECIEAFDANGYWDFSSAAQYERLFGISVVACCDLLQDAGLQSLGPNAKLDITLLVATLIALYHLVNSLSDLVTRKQSLLKEDACHQVGYGRNREVIGLAIEFCQAKDRKYPMSYSTLELGSSWDNVVQKWLEIV